MITSKRLPGASDRSDHEKLRRSRHFETMLAKMVGFTPWSEAKVATWINGQDSASASKLSAKLTPVMYLDPKLRPIAVSVGGATQAIYWKGSPGPSERATCMVTLPRLGSSGPPLRLCSVVSKLGERCGGPSPSIYSTINLRILLA